MRFAKNRLHRCRRVGHRRADAALLLPRRDRTSVRSPTAYPQLFYGCLSVTMAWQIAFLVIGSNPGLTIPRMIEKLG